MAEPGQKIEKPRSTRGFSEKRSCSQNRQLAANAGRKGGQSVAPENRSFSQDRTLAAEAGRKGGQSVHAENRSFSRDRELAADAGRKGGSATSGGSDDKT